MSFAPPPDQTKPILAVTAGATVALVVYFLTQDHIPHVGDNTHNLPHGGSYRDGNKCVSYAGPQRSPNKASTSHLWAFSLICLVSLAIVLVERFHRSRLAVHSCHH